MFHSYHIPLTSHALCSPIEDQDADEDEEAPETQGVNYWAVGVEDFPSVLSNPPSTACGDLGWDGRLAADRIDILVLWNAVGYKGWYHHDW